MNVISTALDGVVIIEPPVFGDSRGFFLETFQTKKYLEHAGINLEFVQDNQSRSQRGVLRGMHAQRENPQGKLVRVSRGKIFDVAADINPDSPTYGQWVGAELDDENHRQMWIPPGYAHGFVVLSDVADFQYKCTDFYYPNDEIGFMWNDPEVSIDWPIDDPQISDRDKGNPTFAELTR